MSLVHYNPDEKCDICGRMYDSWSDLYCPYCPKPPKPKYVETEFEDMNMHQKAHFLFRKLLKEFHNKNNQE